MPITADIRTLYHLAVSPIRGATHAARLESFYGRQAADYDTFRQRLLPGREEMIRLLDFPERGVWVDLGGGTGANLSFARERLDQLAHVYVVDLCPPLLEIADRRIRENGWTNVSTIFADATTYAPLDAADVVTFSYSLTMIPDWFAAVDQAWRALKPGGLIGVVDFHVSRKYADTGRASHSWMTRSLLPLWFGSDNVHLSPDHLPYLERRFRSIALKEGHTRLPWFPVVRVPYYVFIGCKEGQPSDAHRDGSDIAA
jgi:S-adenosylmethionine-diacylgycerolhomoserine-N-methlytransferase